MLTIQMVKEIRGPGSDKSLPSSNPWGSESATYMIMESGHTFVIHTGSHQYAAQGEYPSRLECADVVRESLFAAFGVHSERKFLRAFSANALRWPASVSLLSRCGSVRWCGGQRLRVPRVLHRDSAGGLPAKGEAG